MEERKAGVEGGRLDPFSHPAWVGACGKQDSSAVTLGHSTAPVFWRSSSPHHHSLPPLGASAQRLETALLGWEGDILQQTQKPVGLEGRNASLPSPSPHCILLFSPNEANIIISH